MEATFPEWLEPMAATLTYERFTGADWVFERKYDGIRALAFKQGGHVRLLSRNRLPQHNPAVCQVIAELDVTDVILDGELTWRDDGRISYYGQHLKRTRLHTSAGYGKRRCPSASKSF